MNSGLFQMFMAGRNNFAALNELLQSKAEFLCARYYPGSSSTSVTYNFKVPRNTKSALVIVCGGGGPSQTASSGLATGSGGGALVVAEVYLTPNENIQIVAGGPGGTSTFGKIITCTGGSIGINSTVPEATQISATGGAGGTYVIDRFKIKKLYVAQNGGRGGSVTNLYIHRIASATIITGSGGAGGDGGSISSASSTVSTSVNWNIQTGSGGYRGTGGGISSVTVNNSFTAYCGGGGFLGAGGSISSLTTSSNTSITCAGGGAVGSATSTTAGDKNLYDYETSNNLIIQWTPMKFFINHILFGELYYGSGQDASSTASQFGGGLIGSGTTMTAGFGGGATHSSVTGAIAGTFGGATRSATTGIGGGGTLLSTVRGGAVWVFY